MEGLSAKKKGWGEKAISNMDLFFFYKLQESVRQDTRKSELSLNYTKKEKE